MNWSGLGGVVWEVRFREMEHFVRRMLHISRRDPEEELPDVELTDGERRAALRRAAARRAVGGRG